MNDFALDNQKEKVNDARANGEVVSAIIECFQANDGMFDRQTALAFVADVLGLDEDERSALHIVEQEDGTLTKRNYFYSVVDYTLTDMKNGVFGDDCLIELDGNCWFHVDADNVDPVRTREIAKYKGIKSGSKRRKALVESIIEVYKTFLADKKQLFKKKGGNKEIILQILENNVCTVPEAFDIFFSS